MSSTFISGALAGRVKFPKPDLDKLRFMMLALGDNLHLPRLAELVAAGGVKLTMDCFRKERDPYGRPWKPLKKERARDRRARVARESRGLKSRGHKILQNTARMRNSTAAIWNGRTGGVAIPTGYAASHQDGAHISPHSRLGRSLTFSARVAGRNRFVSQSQRSKLLAKGISVMQRQYNRTFASGITIPQRMMLPDDMLLPASWEKMIGKECAGLLNRWLNQGKVL